MVQALRFNKNKLSLIKDGQTITVKDTEVVGCNSNQVMLSST